MKKLVALLGSLVILSAQAKDILTVNTGKEILTISEIGKRVTVAVNGKIQSHSIIPNSSHRHNITSLLNILKQKGAITASQKNAILKEDLKNLGYKDEIVKVRNGYGMNYLIPKGMAVLATESNRKVIAETIKQRAFKEEKIKKEATMPSINFFFINATYLKIKLCMIYILLFYKNIY